MLNSNPWPKVWKASNLFNLRYPHHRLRSSRMTTLVGAPVFFLTGGFGRSLPGKKIIGWPCCPLILEFPTTLFGRTCR
jgi:hypothetical protein